MLMKLLICVNILASKLVGVFIGRNMFLKGYPLEAKAAPKNWNQSVHISWARLASFCHLGVIRDPLIVSKFYNETHDPHQL